MSDVARYLAPGAAIGYNIATLNNTHKAHHQAANIVESTLCAYAVMEYRTSQQHQQHQHRSRFTFLGEMLSGFKRKCVHGREVKRIFFQASLLRSGRKSHIHGREAKRIFPLFLSWAKIDPTAEMGVSLEPSEKRAIRGAGRISANIPLELRPSENRTNVQIT